MYKKRLGYGEYSSRYDCETEMPSSETIISRINFLNKIGEVAPECWKDLNELVSIYKKYIKSVIWEEIYGVEEINREGYGVNWEILKKYEFSYNKDLINLLINWSDEYSLKDEWCLNVALQILKCWHLSHTDKYALSLTYYNSEVIERNDNYEDSQTLIFDTLEYKSCKIEDIERFKFSYNTFFEPLFFESMPDFKKRVIEEIKVELGIFEKKIREDSRIKDLKRVEVKNKIEHFEWLVLYQVKGKKQGEILDILAERSKDGETPSQSTISTYITQIANFVKLTKRNLL